MTKPTSKESGQLGGTSYSHLYTPLHSTYLPDSAHPSQPKPSQVKSETDTIFTATSENTSTPSTHGHSTDAVSKERGEKTAENMRYGQAISEQGVGGFTVPELNSGSGGEKEEERDEAGMRRVQGYGGEGEMSKNVGG